MTKIMLVGEAWGAREDLFQHALVGSSGAELARMLSQVKLTPELWTQYPSELDMIKYWRDVKQDQEIDITNVFNCRPQENQVDLFFTNAKEGLASLPPLRPGKYLRPEMLMHLERLWQTLSEAQPNLIVAMGNTACWAVLGESKISVLRGTVKISPRLNLKVLPTYHPAAVLRQWNLRPIVLTDLEKAKRESEFKVIKRIERWVTVEPTLPEIVEWFQRPAEYYAVDIENHHGPIEMVGFARNAYDALVIPFLDETKPGWNYWPTVEDEVQAWKLLDAGLKAPVPKLFQNGIYDLTHLLRAGLRPIMCQDDSMLLHHSLYPEMLKGLGFLGSIYANEQAWKQMRGKGNNLKRDE
jgi:uracil-DNA glycosylase